MEYGLESIKLAYYEGSIFNSGFHLFSGMRGHESVVFDEKLWVLAGISDELGLNSMVRAYE